MSATDRTVGEDDDDYAGERPIFDDEPPARASRPVKANGQAAPAQLPAPRIQWIETSAIFEPLPPTPWLMRELGICPGRPSMIAGYGYSGKTLAAQALMLAAASGREAWGHFATGTPRRVRHFDFEQGKHATLKRYQRLATGMNLEVVDLAPRLEVSIFPNAYLNAADAADVYARESEGRDFCVIDALAGATPGTPENDSAIRTCIDTLSRVSEKTGAAFQLVHHTGKGGKGQEDRDLRTIVRGFSGIFDACGSVLLFTAPDDGGRPILVRQIKAPAEAEGRAIDPFYLAIEDVLPSEWTPGGVRIVHRAGKEVAEERKAGREEAAEARKSKMAARIERAIPEAMERMWQALRRAAPRSVTTRLDLDHLIGGDHNVAQAAASRLLATGRARKEKAKGEGHWYEAI